MAVNDKTNEIPHLSEHYYKNRKQFVLFGGLLLAWEFIGIELPKEPFSNVKVIINNPKAIPWVFVALIVYFGIRTLIEWNQSNLLRRRLVVSKIELIYTFIIPEFALVIFCAQQLFDVPAVDLMIAKNVIRFGIYGIISFVGLIILRTLKEILDTIEVVPLGLANRDNLYENKDVDERHILVRTLERLIPWFLVVLMTGVFIVFTYYPIHKTAKGPAGFLSMAGYILGLQLAFVMIDHLTQKSR